jgi:hypothetical protein
MTPSESRLLKLRTEIIALPLGTVCTTGTPGQGNPRDVGPGPRDIAGAIKDIQRLAPMAQPGRSDYPAASGPPVR